MIWPFTRRRATTSNAEPALVALDALDDAALLARACQCDAAAFAVLYERYRMVIYRYIAYRTARQQVAEDLTAEVFLNAWAAIGRYRDRGAGVRAWLLRLAHNEVIDYYRTRRTAEPLPDEGPELPAEAGPEHTLALAAEQQALVAAVRQLHPEWQQLILLRFVEGLSFEEIGVVLGKRSNACRQMQHRALERLRDMLAGEVQHD